MSDPILPNTPVETPNSPDTSLPNTVIHAPDPVVPEPVAAIVDAPSEYRINTLENGQQEVVLNSGQVYRGTPEQVINELAKAQFHASRRITELGQQVQQVPPPANQGPQIDPTAKALADLAAQGMGYANSEALQADLGGMRESYQQHALNQVAAQFMAATPDFQPSEENGNRLDAALQEAGMSPTVRNLQIMHAYLKQSGQYVVSAVPAQQQQRQPGMPLPPNGQQAAPEAPKDIWSMSPAEFAEYENKLRRGIN